MGNLWKFNSLNDLLAARLRRKRARMASEERSELDAMKKQAASFDIPPVRLSYRVIVDVVSAQGERVQHAHAEASARISKGVWETPTASAASIEGDHVFHLLEGPCRIEVSALGFTTAVKYVLLNSSRKVTVTLTRAAVPAAESAPSTSNLLPLLPRPVKREDCANVPRPCPFVGCRYNLYLDVDRYGKPRLNYSDMEPDEMPPEQSCALDIADRGPQKLDTIARTMRLSKERARQIEDEIVRKLRGESVLQELWGQLDGRAVTPGSTPERTDSDGDVDAVEVHADLGGDGLLDGLEWAMGEFGE